jgi:hypothetical protein
MVSRQSLFAFLPSQWPSMFCLETGQLMGLSFLPLAPAATLSTPLRIESSHNIVCCYVFQELVCIDRTGVRWRVGAPRFVTL